MFFRRLLFLSFFAGVCLTATAQQFNLRGLIYKKVSQIRVSQVFIVNKRTNDFRESDDLGRFQIPAKTGDTLLFQKLGYLTLTFIVNSPLETMVYMQPNVLLDEVIIKEQTKKQEINDLVNMYRSKGLYYDGKPPITSFSPFGGSILTGFYELFGKDASNERRFMKMTEEEKEHIEINKRYNIALVKRIIGLTDDKEARAFMDVFTPSLADIREWTDYELVAYIKKSYAYYKDNKPNEVKLPKLY